MIPSKRKIALLAAGIAGCMMAQSANSANWLMLQGTETAKQGQAPRAHLWGFIQAQYQHDTSDANSSNQLGWNILIGAVGMTPVMPTAPINIFHPS